MIIGNWKMHKTAAEAQAFIEALAPRVKKPVYIAAPYPALMPSQGHVHIGAQNVSEYKEGAYTGEVSAQMVAAAGATFTLIGHSERRHLFLESDQVAKEKIQRALEAGLLPVLCVGETEKEREEGQTKSALMRQLRAALDGFSADDQLVIAYEPVWAIGTGRTATPEMAQATHSAIRQLLKELVSAGWAKNATILYGGSVKPGNATQLLAQPDIGGALVGGASLDIENFYKITQG